MPIVVSNAGELRMLDWLLRGSGTNLILRLYTNNHSPTENSTIANFTEANFTGYTSRTLTRNVFNAPVTVAGKAEISYPDQSWTSGSAQTVMGYYVTDAGGNYMFADLFPQSRVLAVGDVLVLTPKFTLASE